MCTILPIHSGNTELRRGGRGGGVYSVRVCIQCRIVHISLFTEFMNNCRISVCSVTHTFMVHMLQYVVLRDAFITSASNPLTDMCIISNHE